MDLNLYQTKKSLQIRELESPSGVLDLVRENLSGNKAHLILGTSHSIKSIKSYLKLKPLPIPCFELPPHNKFFSLSQLYKFKINKWQAWARKGEGLFLAEPLGLLKKTSLEGESLELKVGDSLPDLKTLGYKEKDFAESKGTFSLKGYICDLFSLAYETPIRIELSGDKILSFDLLDENLKKRNTTLKKALVPSLKRKTGYEKRQKLCKLLKEAGISNEEIKKVSRGEDFEKWKPLLDSSETSCFLDYFLEPPMLWMYHLKKTESFFKETLEKEYSQVPFHFKDLFLPWERLEKERVFSLGGLTPPSFDFFQEDIIYPCKNLKPKSLKEAVENFKEQTFIFLSRDNEEEKELKKTLSQEYPSLQKNNFFLLNEKSLIFLKGSLEESWCNEKEGIAYLLTKNLIKTSVSREHSFEFFQKKIKALDFSQLEKGGLVVHRQYGVGIFKELKTLTIGERRQDFFVLTYKKGDKLLLPAYKANEIKKYSQRLSFQFKDSLLDSLGNQNRWEQKKEKAKKHIEELTLGLLSLYRSRQKTHRLAYEPTSNALLKFSKDFSFEETRSQKQAIQEIMEDMDKNYPMERLLCADVGFGKTEVALRIALRAIENNFQVCFLSPTTVLSLQHYENFKERFKNWPIRICLLNRFLSAQNKKKVFQEIGEGKIDFIVATHQALTSELFFKNLSLCIIDEEHRFGVGQKEYLRRFNKNLDILSLSATPLPRTLNMALSGLKDISVISEPPKERKAIKTFIKFWNNEEIKRACEFEKKRGGQVLFVHNRIKNLQEKAEKLKALLPDFKIAVAHGRLPSQELEELMINFLNKKFDILLSTTLIESGMDIPEANTLFINEVQNLGLSQIYQLKGRVGRGVKQAYCYFLIPKTKALSPLQEERLNLLEKYKELGSGFQLALHDLETRGAGEIFGAEQSGHLTTVGQDLYFEFLNENLKNTNEQFLEPEIKLSFSAYLPESFLPDPKLRLLYYKNLSEAKNSESLFSLQEDLRENFGYLPQEVLNLFFLLTLRNFCLPLFIRELKLTDRSLFLTFDQRSSFPINEVLKSIEKEGWEMKGEFSLKIPVNKETSKKQTTDLLKRFLSQIKK